jgi:hypothetical protein
MPTPSKKLKPFMAYIDESQHVSMTKLSKKTKTPMSQLVREAINMRVIPGNPYVNGFNAGLNKAMSIVAGNNASQMRFPSGKSFAELINEEIATAIMEEESEAS